MNVDQRTIFCLLVGAAVVSTIGIIVSAKSLISLVKSDFFIERLKKAKNSDALRTIVLILMTTAPGYMMAQAAEAVEASEGWTIGEYEIVLMIVLNLVLVGIILFLKQIMGNMLDMVMPKPVEPEVEEVSVVEKINHVLTDIVPIEDEHSILMDHEYDGIQELDNNLPPWWKWGFYVTIFAGVIYLLNFHILGTGDLQYEAYKKDIAEKSAEVDAYLLKMALNVDENSVVPLADQADLKKGHNIFSKNCAVCHLEDGGGQTGPNLTDDYWLYGPDIKSIFKTVKYGANNGMTAWQNKLSPVEIQQVSSYIQTLVGTTPLVGKEPQGEYMPMTENETATPDSLQAQLR